MEVEAEHTTKHSKRDGPIGIYQDVCLSWQCDLPGTWERLAKAALPPSALNE